MDKKKLKIDMCEVDEIFPLSLLMTKMNADQKIKLLSDELSYYQKKTILLEKVLFKLMNELNYVMEDEYEEFIKKNL